MFRCRLRPCRSSMIPQTQQRSVQSTGVLGTATKFHLNELGLAHIFRILRGSLYSDKPAALLREYWANGKDAHRDAFIDDVPVDVTLPTIIEPTLVIRDYGFGLSEEAVRSHIGGYGMSSKRDSNDTVGFMGIGSKSAFCYVDTFTVTSFYQGTRTVYRCVLDESDLGDVIKVWEEPCGDETGIEIRIAVMPADIPDFARAATYLFPYADTPPRINIPITPRPFDPRRNGFVFRPQGDETRSAWIAIMGGIPYKIDFSKMAREIQEAGFADTVACTEGGLYFGIGDVSVAASREEVEYTPRTKQAIVQGLQHLLSDIMGELSQKLQAPDKSNWDRRMDVLTWNAETRIPLAQSLRPWSVPVVKFIPHINVRDGDGNAIHSAAQTSLFHFRGFRKSRDPYNPKREILGKKLEDFDDLPISPSTRIILCDCGSIKRGAYTGEDRLVVFRKPVSLEAVEARIDAYCKLAGVEGVPIVTLSSLLAGAPSRKSGGQKNTKHTVRRFVYNNSGRRTNSENWDIIDHEPGEGDVFVVLSGFIPVDDSSWYSRVTEDQKLFRLMGLNFPTILGVKTTVKHPVDVTTILGTPYATWRKRAYKDALAESAELREAVEASQWKNFYSWFDAKRTRDALKAHLASTHPIVEFLSTYIEREAHFTRLSADKRMLSEGLSKLRLIPNKAAQHRERVVERYPLLQTVTSTVDFSVLTRPDIGQLWLDYVALIDKVHPL